MKPIKSFRELLQMGQKNFENSGENVTGIEESTFTSPHVQELKMLNRCMYTTYSTNKGDKVFTLQGVLPLSDYVRILPFLKQQGYWFVAMNPLDKKIWGKCTIKEEDWDPNANFTKTVRKFSGEDAEGLSKTWKQLTKFDGNDEAFFVNNSVPIHYFDPMNIDAIIKDFGEELEYVDEELFQGDDPLIDLFIEDPIVGRTSLYRKVLQNLCK